MLNYFFKVGEKGRKRKSVSVSDTQSTCSCHVTRAHCWERPSLVLGHLWSKPQLSKPCGEDVLSASTASSEEYGQQDRGWRGRDCRKHISLFVSSQAENSPGSGRKDVLFHELKSECLTLPSYFCNRGNRSCSACINFQNMHYVF